MTSEDWKKLAAMVRKSSERYFAGGNQGESYRVCDPRQLETLMLKEAGEDRVACPCWGRCEKCRAREAE